MATQTQKLTAASFSGTSITSVKSVNTSNPHVQETDFVADSASNVTAVFLDGEHFIVSVVTADLEFKDNWSKGTSGSLVITETTRANGKGTASGSVISTYSDAVLIGIDTNSAVVGEADLTLTFKVTDPAGTGLVSYS